MSIIHLNIDDPYIHSIGIHAIKEFIERQLSLLSTQKIGEKIILSIKESEFDHKNELEKSRSEAWLEYKAKYFT